MTISIAIPTRNPAPAHLDALFASLRGQEMLADEIVVMDDASQNSVVESRCRRWSGDILPIRLQKRGTRVGMVANWNAAVRACTGTHVVLVGQDDVLGPSFLRRSSELCTGSVVAVACANGYMNDSGTELRPRLRVNHRLRLYPSPGVYRIPRTLLIEFGLRNGNIIGEPSCVLFRRDGFEAVGGYDPSMEHAVDLDFALRLLEVGAVVYVNEALVYRRLHSASATTKNIRTGVAARERHSLYVRHGSKLSRQGDNRVRASLMARALKDVALGLTTGNPALTAVALRLSWQVIASGPPHPHAIIEIVRELVTGRNADTRLVGEYRLACS